jgi:hypothetical protein
LEKLVSDPYLLYLANKNMFKQIMTRTFHFINFAGFGNYHFMLCAWNWTGD